MINIFIDFDDYELYLTVRLAADLIIPGSFTPTFQPPVDGARSLASSRWFYRRCDSWCASSFDRSAVSLSNLKLF